ncbi:hypothetical protein COOONC_10942 [Cooperia oncophora]
MNPAKPAHPEIKQYSHSSPFDARPFDSYISQKDLFTQFGFGCIYCQKKPENAGYGMERLSGARKGIKSCRLFFKSQNLMHSVREIDGLQYAQGLDFKENGIVNPKWREVNDFVKGLI